jgi:hypothetical protein
MSYDTSESRLQRAEGSVPKQMSLEEQSDSYRVQAEYDDALSQHNRRATRQREGETLSDYNFRLLNEVKQFAPSFKNMNSRNVGSPALNVLKDQIIKEATKEAQYPTMVPDGTLKEVARYDVTGRKSLEFFGRPSAWMNQFAFGTRKRLVGIRTENVHGYIPNP